MAFPSLLGAACRAWNRAARLFLGDAVAMLAIPIGAGLILIKGRPCEHRSVIE
jgi:hypothetical protein